MHSYPRKPKLVLTVSYSSCYTSATLTRRYSLTYATFHPPSSRMGSSASRAQWCGRTLELQKLLGLQQRHEFPPTLCCPQPLLRHSFLFLVHRQEHSVLCQHGQCRHGPLWGRDPPPPHPPTQLPAHSPASPDTKHDLVMSYLSVCACIIQIKWWSYVTVAL